MNDNKKNTLIIFCIISFGMVMSFYFFSNLAYASEPKQVNDFNFVAAGDWGCDLKAKKTVINMKNHSPELVLALGDLSYQKYADCWFNLISPLINITKIAIGDHEFHFKNSTRYDQYVEKFNLDNQFYSFDLKNVHFIAMSSEIPFGFNSDQYIFVQNDLKLASENKSIKWIVVYLYEMLYSSKSKHESVKNIRDIYHPLFEKYSVDLVLQAHNHNYQRTFPLKFNPSNSSEPVIADYNTREYNDPGNPIFIIAGTAGADQYPLGNQSYFIAEQFNRFGFVEIKISKSENNHILNGTFYENREGTDKDWFVIKKSIKNMD